MKNTIKTIGIIALAVIIGFALVACGDYDEALNGTWVFEYYDEEDDETSSTKYVFNNGDITFYMDDEPLVKGTYSNDGNKITITITHMNGGMFQESSSVKWYNRQQIKTETISDMVKSGVTQEQAEAVYKNTIEPIVDQMFASQTGTYSINGNKLTITFDGESIVLTKK